MKEEGMPHPKVSVLIPVYNVEKYVRRCIDSVLNQTMQEGVEVVIVNDCTPDGSMEKIYEALRAYEERVPDGKRISVRVVNHDTNRGQAAARNTAMSYATGKYIIHMDSDDYMELNMIEELYHEAVRTDADIVGCDFYYDYGGGCKKVNHSFKFKPSSEYNLNSLMMCDYTANVWRRLVRRWLFVEHNLSEIEGLKMGEDVIITIQLHYYARKVAYVAKPLYNYVQNPTSLVHLVSREQVEEILKAYVFVKRFLEEKNIYEKYKIGFLKRCFYVKVPFVLRKKVRNISHWRTIYPESHDFLSVIIPNRMKRFYWQMLISAPKPVAHLLLCLYDLTKAIKGVIYKNKY